MLTPSAFGAGGPKPNQNTCACGLVPGVPNQTKTRLESSIQNFNFNPDLFIMIDRGQGASRVTKGQGVGTVTKGQGASNQEQHANDYATMAATPAQAQAQAARVRVQPLRVQDMRGSGTTTLHAATSSIPGTHTHTRRVPLNSGVARHGVNERNGRNGRNASSPTPNGSDGNEGRTKPTGPSISNYLTWVVRPIFCMGLNI